MSALAGGSQQVDQNRCLQEAEIALLSLGYKPGQASQAVAGAARQLEQEGRVLDSEALIRLALKNMV